MTEVRLWRRRLWITSGDKIFTPTKYFRRVGEVIHLFQEHLIFAQWQKLLSSPTDFSDITAAVLRISTNTAFLLNLNPLRSRLPKFSVVMDFFCCPRKCDRRILCSIPIFSLLPACLNFFQPTDYSNTRPMKS